MGQLIHQGDLGAPGQDRVEVHFFQAAAPVVHHLAGDDLQAVDQFLGQLASVTLDEPDDNVGAPAEAPVTLVEHRVGLADARDRAEVNPEATGGLDHAGGVAIRRFARRRLVAHGFILTPDDGPR